MKTQTTAALALMILLSACGGAGTSNSEAVSIPSFNSAVDVIEAGQQALDRITATELTLPGDIPTTGTADYAGTIVLNDNNGGGLDASVVGGIVMEVDFANADNVTGTAGNFFDLADTSVSGTLDLTNVAFASGTAGGGFEAELDGTLRNVGPTGVDTDFVYDLDVASVYWGDNADTMIVLMDGTAAAVGSMVDRDISGAASLE